MNPRIETLTEKKLVGKRKIMSFRENSTAELWGSFMPERREIKNIVGSQLYSVQVYDPSYFSDFEPYKYFEKWAAIEVADFDSVPDNMETFNLKGGLYAIFVHQGSGTDDRTFRQIFTNWLPNSAFLLDNRPHFEILGEKYKNGDPNSEEEIWIPIKLKH